MDYLSHKFLSFPNRVVINYDMPLRSEKFAHRCARYSEQVASSMVVVSFVTDEKEKSLAEQCGMRNGSTEDVISNLL